MKLLVSGASRVVRDYPDVGVLVVPAAGNAPRHVQGRTWAMDNGAFSGLDVSLFLKMLRLYRGQAGCLFVTVPDVVADATATMELFKTWEPVIHAWHWPVAFVGQDGLSLADVPWDACEAVFLGGSTAWKLGRVASDLAAYAKARGKWVHMGRVNSQRRIAHVLRIGCDSIDGTSWSRWSRRYIPTYQPTLDRINVAGGLFV